MNNYKLGKAGEEFAMEYLKQNGMRIIDKNFRSRFAEIDLVAEKNKTIYFVEVKKRKNATFGFGYEAVNFKKIHKIFNLSEVWISKNKKYINYAKQILVVDITAGKIKCYLG